MKKVLYNIMINNQFQKYQLYIHSFTGYLEGQEAKLRADCLVKMWMMLIWLLISMIIEKAKKI